MPDKEIPYMDSYPEIAILFREYYCDYARERLTVILFREYGPRSVRCNAVVLLILHKNAWFARS